MRKSRFSEEQIIAILKESEGGMETGELCRRHGIAKACFYRWKSKYGGLELSEARRLRQLEEENRQLKHTPSRYFSADAAHGGQKNPLTAKNPRPSKSKTSLYGAPRSTSRLHWRQEACPASECVLHSRKSVGL